MTERENIQIYLKQCRQQGMKDNEIINSLVSVGWKIEDAKLVVIGTSKIDPVHTKKHKIFWVILIIIVLLVVSGCIYLFVFLTSDDVSNQTSVSQKDETNKSLLLIFSQPPANNSDDVIATVFGENILRKDVEDITLMIMESDMAAFGREYDSIEMDTLNILIHSLVAKEAVRRIGEDPLTDDELYKYLDSEITEDEWSQYLELNDVNSEHISSIRLLHKYQLRETELDELVDENIPTVFHTLLGENVQQIYDAFNNKLSYLTKNEKEDLRFEFDGLNFSGLPYSDPNYLINDSNDLVIDAEIPTQIKNELLNLENTPNQLTSLVDDGQYYYFGMVFIPKEYDYPPGFTLSDTLLVRFPWGDGTYEMDIITMLLNQGVLDNEILIYEAPGFKLEPPIHYIDLDGDGLNNLIERVYGTDLNKVDTDADGILDKDEYDAGTNLLE